MVIGICGYKGSGKSVVAKYIADNYGFKRLNFKDALVEEMKERLPNTLEQIVTMYYTAHGIKSVDELFAKKPPVMRALMQEYGTEVRRTDNPNYWVEQWNLDVMGNPASNIVTDDVRFTNEMSAVKGRGGIIIRIVRDDITSGGTHLSETEQESFDADFVVTAEKGDISGMCGKIDTILSTISRD